MPKKQDAFSVGVLVAHPSRPQWGPGRIVGVSEERLHVFFRDDMTPKAKVILTELVALSVCDVQQDTVLDALPEAKYDGQNWIMPPAKRTAASRKKAAAAALAVPVAGV